jgi:hypothetical protein
LHSDGNALRIIRGDFVFVRAVHAQSDRAHDRESTKNCEHESDSTLREDAPFESGGKTVHDDLRKTFFSARIAAL